MPSRWGQGNYGRSKSMRQECDCHCYAEYPNECHKQRSGKWKCVDRYEPIKEWVNHSKCQPVTHCRKKEQEHE